jgi:RNA polymerase sigma factor (sigma-70 family)
MSQPKMVRDFLQNRQALLGFIFALTRDQVVAEEVFQEVALAILGEASTGKAVEPFLPWAREVARRRVAEYFRKSSRREGVAPLTETMMDALSLAFEENDEVPERDIRRMASLRQCVEALSGRAREAIDLRYRVSYGIEKIASELAWRVDSVNVLLAKTRKALAECVRAKLAATEAS